MRSLDRFEVKKLLTNVGNVSVYEVYDAEGQASQVRLFSADQSHLRRIDSWYGVYEEYQQKVTNFKHLPRIDKITSPDGLQAYAVLSLTPGGLLTEGDKLSHPQVEQLLDAVQHLHAKGIFHGGLVAKNIWLTRLSAQGPKNPCPA